MGQAITACIADDPNLVLTVALESKDHPKIGRFANEDEEVCISSDFDSKDADVFIDFSTPLASIELISKCSKDGIPMVIGVTGFSKDDDSRIAEAARDIAIMAEPNMSIGANVIFHVIEYVARVMKNFDAEVFEAHHRNKKDAPSGTALRLGEVIAWTRGQEFDKVAVFDRNGKDCARKKGEIGFSVMRGGDIVGEHRVLFANDGEQLEIVHRATGRKHFVMGALLACDFVAEATPGLYDMRDVIEGIY